MTKISSKNQVTLPVETLRRSGLRSGDEVLIESAGSGQIVLRRVAADPAQGLGIFDGLYPPGYLDDLRAAERA